MGYRSDVVIAHAFENEDIVKEIMAIYAMHPIVQQLELLKDWTVKENLVFITYEDVKWYDTYDDVQAIKHLEELTKQFHTERGISYATVQFRIGEDMDDVETAYDYSENDNDVGFRLHDVLQSNCGIERSTYCNL